MSTRETSPPLRGTHHHHSAQPLRRKTVYKIMNNITHSPIDICLQQKGFLCLLQLPERNETRRTPVRAIGTFPFHPSTRKSSTYSLSLCVTSEAIFVARLASIPLTIASSGCKDGGGASSSSLASSFSRVWPAPPDARTESRS